MASSRNFRRIAEQMKNSNGRFAITFQFSCPNKKIKSNHQKVFRKVVVLKISPTNVVRFVQVSKGCYQRYGNFISKPHPWTFFDILNMEYNCHIFLKYLVFQMKNLVFQLKTQHFSLRLNSRYQENYYARPLVVFVCCKCLDCNKETKRQIKKNSN